MGALRKAEGLQIRWQLDPVCGKRTTRGFAGERFQGLEAKPVAEALTELQGVTSGCACENSC